MRAGVIVAMLGAVAACGGGNAPPGDPCEDYVPPRDDGAPFGSGHAGAWTTDAAGLPAYDLLVDERCDAAAQYWSPRPHPQRDPIHAIGDGFGTVAMAHASGGIDLYAQDRGHEWLVRVDEWADPENPDFGPQHGGGLGSVMVDGERRSTRFEDFPVGEALARQTRRFGVGYVETVTRWDDLTVTRRTFAMPGTRALVTEVTLESEVARDVEVSELWDVNLSEIPVALVTSDLLVENLTDNLERDRRALAGQFEHTASFDGARVAQVRTTAKSPEAAPDEPSEVDWYPPTVWLAALDGDAGAAWLRDTELYGAADATARDLALDGAGQPALLALQVAVHVPAGAPVTTRFAVGVSSGLGDGGEVAAAVDNVAVRDPRGEIEAEAWNYRVVHADFGDLPHGAEMARELAWSSYAVQALATHDDYRDLRLLGQGGSYKYIHGLDGAMGDLAIFADAIELIDPDLAGDTLAYAFGAQLGSGADPPWRFPYATTGHGLYSDVGRYTRRSDAYFLLPSQVARHVALTRDAGFLDREVPYWPRSAGESGTVLDHLRRTDEFVRQTLGFGARGLVAMGTGDYADGVLQTATEPATSTGTSSTYNAGFVVTGFGLLAQVLAGHDDTLAASTEALRADQAAKLESEAWNGEWYERGFVDSGNPIATDRLFLEPQLFPILADLVPADRRTALLALITERLETPIGAMSTIALDGSGGSTGAPQIGGVWPVANAWLTEAYAIEDPDAGWDSFVRNTLFMHAAEYPDLWYGIWTGPDSFYGPDAERPGEADANLATALTDYPALNAHVHTGPLRALMAVAGIHPEADGITLAPRMPTETFSIAWPHLSLTSTPTLLSGSTDLRGPQTLHVTLTPTLAAAASLTVLVDNQPRAFTRSGDVVSFAIPGVAEWMIGAP